MAQAIQALVDTIRAHFQSCRTERRDIGAALDHLRATIDARPVAEGAPIVPPANTAAQRYLAGALAAGAAGPAGAIAAAIGRARDGLVWHYNYAPVPGQPDLPEKVAFCEILGPRAGLRSDATRLGFSLLGPATHYPMHAHPAVELYYVLAGTARWITPSAAAEQPPGAFILHRASEPHAMETAGEALLALYSWSGDIESPSLYVKP
ncbi:MAG: cupin [Alphaproteobacteria bacterium]|nr:cupin [Alphaproteobacteria bacterium]